MVNAEDTAAAAGAEAVWFADRMRVWQVLAAKVAAGESCNEWFWPLAAPGWNPGTPVAETLRIACDHSFEFRGLAGTLQVAGHLVREGHGEALVHAVDASVVLGWLVEIIPAASAPGLPDRRSRRRVRRELALPEPWRGFLGTLARKIETREPRFVWMLSAAILDMATTPVLTPEFGLRVALGMREHIWDISEESE